MHTENYKLYYREVTMTDPKDETILKVFDMLVDRLSTMELTLEKLQAHLIHREISRSGILNNNLLGFPFRIKRLGAGFTHIPAVVGLCPSA